MPECSRLINSELLAMRLAGHFYFLESSRFKNFEGLPIKTKVWAAINSYFAGSNCSGLLANLVVDLLLARD